jgi:penicillin-binding protein 1C
LDQPGTYYGPALALGSAEVSLWEIVNAYRTLANGGRAGELRLVDGGSATAPRRIYSEEAAFVVADVLSDRESRIMTFDFASPLTTRFWTGVKTGTSKDMRDNWCVGFSQRYTVGVWVGNFSGYPMADVSGVSGAAPVWLEVMQHLHREVSSGAPIPPPTLSRQRTRFAGGSEPQRHEWFLEETGPIDGTLVLARHDARIVAPAPGSRIALDREIPAAQQRVLFEASPGDGSLSWVLDGELVARGVRFLWSPAPGRHRVQLLDSSGRTLDDMSFAVAGTRKHLR